MLGVNRSTFIRRSVAVVIAKVLDVPLASVLAESPRAMRTGASNPRTNGGHDTGEDIEKWCAHPGCTGKHLRVYR